MDINYIKKAPRYCIIRNMHGDGAEPYEFFHNLTDATDKFSFYSNNLVSTTKRLLENDSIIEWGDKLCRIMLYEVQQISNLELSELLETKTEKDFYSKWEFVVLDYGRVISFTYTYRIEDEEDYSGDSSIGINSNNMDEELDNEGEWVVKRTIFNIDDL